MKGVRLLGKEKLATSLYNWKVTKETARDCRDWCHSTKGCVAWNFYKGSVKLHATEYCVLLKSIDCNRLDLNIDWVSGVSTNACKNFF